MACCLPPRNARRQGCLGKDQTVNPLKRFRYWIAEPLINELRDLHTQDIVNNSKYAYEQGLRVGQALGQLQGQQSILAQLAQDNLVSPEEAEQARIALIH